LFERHLLLDSVVDPFLASSGQKFDAATRSVPDSPHGPLPPAD